MLLAIQYPMFREPLEADFVAPGIARLREFSMHIPLGPDDLVRHDQRKNVIGIMRTTDHFIVEAHLELAWPQTNIDQLIDEWSMATDVAQSTGCTVLVRSLSRAWIDDKVRHHPAVKMIHVVRVPTQIINLDREVRAA